MPLVPTAEIVDEARRADRGVGAFNVIQLEHAEAIVAGAARTGRPVILQLSENTVRYHGGLGAAGAAAVALARDADARAAVHLDHATALDLCRQAADLGFGSVMFDGSRLPYEENVRATGEVARWAHDDGLWVEAELGEVGGKEGAHAPGVRTDPDEARRYVTETGVDGLAVAVGTSHAMSRREAVLDLDLIAALREAVPVPLVLHGSSGVPDEQLAAAVRSGMTKINLATILNAALTQTVRRVLARDADLVDPRKYLGPGRDAVAGEVARLLRLLARDPAPDERTSG
ncbi:MAG: class II fructose-bisphosphate aldolase [Streptosporangiaceae bacterium]